MASDEPILLVEDHPDTAAALCELLTQRGYSVVPVANGQQALDRLEAGLRPRLILVDLLLPGVSGFQLLEYLHSEHELRGTPTVVITAVPKEQVRVIADVVFSKPLDYAMLTETIDQLVARH